MGRTIYYHHEYGREGAIDLHAVSKTIPFYGREYHGRKLREITVPYRGGELLVRPGDRKGKGEVIGVVNSGAFLMPRGFDTPPVSAVESIETLDTTIMRNLRKAGFTSVSLHR